MVWWMWAVLGLVFLIGEILTPGGIFIIFFAAGALVVFVLEAVGVHMPFWVQLLIFGVLSVGSLLLFRKRILRRVEKNNPTHEVDSAVGEEVTAQSDIAVGGSGTVEYRGTPWKALNSGTVAVAVGETCVVDKLDGLKLYVHKKVAVQG